jgi:hypothetical protein
VGTANLSTSLPTSVNRVVAFVNANGTVSTSLCLSNNFSVTPYSAITDGANVWMGVSSGGLRHVALNDTATVTTISSSPPSPRFLSIFNNQLYTSAANTSSVRIGAVGNGLPVTAGQSTVSLPGIPLGVGTPHSFVQFDTDNDGTVDLLYMADETRGLMKYAFNGTVWVARDSVAITGLGSNLLTGLTGKAVAGRYTLYGSTSSSLLRIVDTALQAAPFAGTITAIATAGTNTTFKGVSFTPGTSVLSMRTLSTVGNIRNAVSTMQQQLVQSFRASAGPSTIQLQAMATKGTDAQLSIVDLYGRVVHTEKWSLSAGSNSLVINSQYMAKGIYVAVLAGKYGKQSSRLLVQ